MKNEKNLTIAEQFKEQLNIPKTETRIILETEDLYSDLSQRFNRSKLSPAARQKVVNHNKPYQSQNQETYGPCAAPNCPCPSLPFDLKIKIEGNSRSWAQHSDFSTLPGYWESASHLLGDYYWKRELWLNRTDQGRHAINLMNGKNLWTVNAAGLFCIENDSFCRSATNTINGCISYHERKNAIQGHEVTIGSNTSKVSRWGFKTGAAVAAACTGNPAVAIGVGAAALGVGKAGQTICDSDRGKAFWGTVGDMGQEGVLGGIAKNISNKYPYPDAFPGASKPNKLIDTVGNFAGPIGGSAADHVIHQITGHHDPDCIFCKK